MYKSGHRGINMMLYSPILFLSIVLEMFIFGILGWLFMTYFAHFPDIDLKFRFIKHRGFTHTISFAFIFGLFTSIVSLFLFSLAVHNSFILIGVLISSFILGAYTIIGHIIGDVLTPTGVKPLQKPKYAPDLDIFSDKKYTLDWVSASNKPANIGFLCSGLVLTSISTFSGLAIVSAI